ncbi:MAG: hypothetical protein Q4D05_03885 [Acinetobacter sp.]|nr:hypothetical protein [Acinetobacter sp.]
MNQQTKAEILQLHDVFYGLMPYESLVKIYQNGADTAQTKPLFADIISQTEHEEPKIGIIDFFIDVDTTWQAWKTSDSENKKMDQFNGLWKLVDGIKSEVKVAIPTTASLKVFGDKFFKEEDDLTIRGRTYLPIVLAWLMIYANEASFEPLHQYSYDIEELTKQNNSYCDYFERTMLAMLNFFYFQKKHAAAKA